MVSRTGERFLSARGLGVLGCIVLVFLVGLASAVHVHADSSAISEHSCAVCALVHAGVAPASAICLNVAFARTADVPTICTEARSLLAPEPSWIRPPPAV